MAKTRERIPRLRQVGRFRKWACYLRIACSGAIVLVIATFLFITLFTQAAAELTNRVLRPVMGPQLVIHLERLYFNSFDWLQRTKYRYVSPDDPSPQPTPGRATGEVHSDDCSLNLDPIPVIHSFKAVAEEGVWRERPLAIFPDRVIMAIAIVRPDPTRAFAFTTLVQIDARQVFLHAVAGRKQPGGPLGRHGSGMIPPHLVQSGRLVAAFSGGFQYRDGEYGMVVDDTVYVPLKETIGTLIGYRDGSLKIVNYQGEELGKEISFVRQNCPILVENGSGTELDPKNRALWGRTLTSDIYTWRSGIGLTKEGNIVYAVGNNLVPTALADALIMGGAINAIQLDINPYWVRFNIFDSQRDGKYESSTLTEELHDGTGEFLRGYDKDFFYIYKR